MGADRSRCRDLRPSRAAIAKMESFQIIDPMLYAPTIDGHGTEKHHVFCPFTAQVRPQRPEAGGGGIRFDLAGHARPSPDCARGPPAASHSETSPKKWGSATPMACPVVNAPKEGDRHANRTTPESPT